MRPLPATLAALALVMPAVLAGCLSSGGDGEGSDPRDDDAFPAPQLAFITQVDAERWSGEPSILALEDGTLLITGVSGFTRYAETPDDAPCRFGQSYIWRSTDNGTTWQFVGHPLSPHECVFYRNLILGIEGDLARDDMGRAYFVDMTFFPGVNGLSRSDDSGATWTAAQNPAVGLPGTDRPWVAAHGDGEVWVKYLTQASSPADPTGATAPWRVARSADAGRTFVEDVAIPYCSQADMYVDPARFLLIPCNNGGEVSILRSPTGGRMEWERLPVTAIEGASAGGFPGVAVAGKDTYIATWIEHGNGTNRVRYAYSLDAGASWELPAPLTAGNATASFPWIDADREGRVGIVWYEAAVAGDPNSVEAEWHVMHASMRIDASGLQGLAVQQVTEDPVHVGSICDAGLGCVVDGRSEDRRLLDFFEIDIEGASSHVTWTSTRGDVPTIWYGRLDSP